MKAKLRTKLLEALAAVKETGLMWNSETKQYDDTEISPPVFEKGGSIYVSGESDSSYLFVDYYGEFRGNLPWVNEKLDKVAAEFNCYWEWENPGCVVLCEN